MNKKDKTYKKNFPVGAFVPFFELFPYEAEMNTRKIFLSKDIHGLSRGAYLFVENYCVDKKCDCRKVMINVVQMGDEPVILGTVGFGWEDEAYYIKWIGDKDNGRLMVGAYLEPGGIQTSYAQNCFKLVKNSLKDSHYIDLIKERYRAFKERL